MKDRPRTLIFAKYGTAHKVVFFTKELKDFKDFEDFETLVRYENSTNCEIIGENKCVFAILLPVQKAN